MADSLYIAWRYIAYHKVRTIVLVVSITLILYLPLALRVLVKASQRELMARAAATPLLVGAKGSSLDLAIDTLYFEPKPLEAISMAEVQRVDETGLAHAIPIYTRFRARKHTIVGATLEYFDFRGLAVERGLGLTRLGDCVLGATAAKDLGLGPGDHLLSLPENVFDLAGTYPLRMRIVGVLQRSYSPDDLSVFVDLKTAWIIQGLGHGHQDLARVDDPNVLLSKEDNQVTANAKLVHFNEITDENIGSFHFHGDRSGFPITAVIARPHDQKSETLLRGKYQRADERCQIIRPVEVIEDLTSTIFRIEGVLDTVFLLVGLAMLLLIVLVIMLSLRLRHREMQTMYKLGCSRMKIAGILTSELSIIGLSGVVLASLFTWLTSLHMDELLREFVL